MTGREVGGVPGGSPALRARTASGATLVNTAALVALRDVERNGRKGTPPPLVARAMCHVSMAVREVYRTQPSERADPVARSVAAQVLNQLVGTHTAAALGEEPSTVMRAGRVHRPDIAARAVARAATDGASAAGTPRPVDGSDGRPRWTAIAADGSTIQPLLPSFGQVKPVVEANALVRARPPQLTDDDWRAYFARFNAPLSEAEVRCARFWADGPGTFTPPGHWNAIASECASAARLSAAEAAELFALVNAALHDAGVVCWETKYTHGGERPFQAAKRLGIPFEPLLPTPPFPGYTSGHATFSAAAAEVLGRFFDDRGNIEDLRKLLAGHSQLESSRQAIRDARTAGEMFSVLAQEAADSRILGGIHIAEDGVEGVRIGREIGRNAYEAMVVRGEL